jgi:hypothetical protein
MGSRKVNTADIDEDLLVASIGIRKQDGMVQPAAISPPADIPGEKDEVTGTEENAGPLQPEPPQAPVPPKEKTQKDGNRRKRADDESWDTVFRQKEIKTRQCVYISRDVHNKILKIVNNIAEGKISVGAFTDNILSLYLEQNKDRINELYRQQRNDLI